MINDIAQVVILLLAVGAIALTLSTMSQLRKIARSARRNPTDDQRNPTDDQRNPTDDQRNPTDDQEE